MQSTHTREQDFMAVTAEIEVLHQQLKGKGMYTVSSTFPTTSDPKPSNNVHFQPNDPAHKSSVHTMNQLLLNSSLNLLDDLPRPQSSSSNGPIPCGQTTPQGSVHASNSPTHVPLCKVLFTSSANSLKLVFSFSYAGSCLHLLSEGRACFGESL